MSSQGETITNTPTITTQVNKEEWFKGIHSCPLRQAKLEKIIEQQRDGTLKSKDIKETEEVTTLLDPGGTNPTVNKFGSDDDELASDLHDMFNGVDVSPNRKGNVTPLQSDDEKRPENEVSYSEEEDYLEGLDGDPNDQSKDMHQINQSKDMLQINQSKDMHQINQSKDMLQINQSKDMP
jgi:hypothetical protein